jgi:hypothetical protein
MQTRRKAAVLSVLAWVAAAVVQAAESKEISQTVPLDLDGRVYLENFKGSITVTTWDRPEVAISVHIDPDGRASDPLEQKKVALTEVRVTGSGSSVTIRTDYDRLSSVSFVELFTFHDRSLPFAHYTIQMPATAHLEIKDYKSEIHVSDLKSELKLETYKGSAEVTRLDGDANVETYKGSIRVEFARFQRDSRFETYKGEIDVRMPRDSRFSLDADTGRHGEVDSDFSMMSSARHSTSGRATGAVNGGGPTLRFRTYRGTFRIHAS